jgi:hypothetical protein
MPFRPAGRKRKTAVQAVERLNRALLIDAEDSGVLRWIQIETDNVSGLFFKLQIVAGM